MPTSDRWDKYFLGMCLLSAKMSKDPNTKVGSVIVDANGIIRATGFNGFPRGYEDSQSRLRDRDWKNLCIIHAERNAILSAARVGVPLEGCAQYLVATDDSGEIWGGPPCTACAIEMIQAGIKEVIAYPFKSGPSKWRKDVEFASRVLEEAGVFYREVPNDPR